MKLKTLNELALTFKNSSALDNIEDPKIKKLVIKNIDAFVKETLSQECTNDQKQFAKLETTVSLQDKQLVKIKELEKENKSFKSQLDEVAPILAEKKLNDQKELYKDVINPDSLADAFKLIDVSEEDTPETIKEKFTQLVKDKPQYDLGPVEDKKEFGIKVSKTGAITTVAKPVEKQSFTKENGYPSTLTSLFG